MSFLRLTPSPAKLLLLGLLTLGIAAPVSAQTFVGSDNFTGGSTANWDFTYRLSGATQGVLTFTNDRLDFSKGEGFGNQFHLWNSDGTPDPLVTPTSFTTSWVMSVTATNTIGVPGSGEFASIGLNLFNDASEYYSVMLNWNEGGLFARLEGTGYGNSSVSLGDGTDVTLRISWDAGSQLLSAGYSTDGINFNSVGTDFNPVTGWANSDPASSVDNGFNFGVFGQSNMAGAISVGSMQLDNFSVSAVPEPSTYAAIAGALMLGFAVWRRRKVRA